MANSNLISFTSSGLYCTKGNFFIDPVKPVNTAIISHAHADHANPYSAQMFGTGSTIDLIRHRYRCKQTGTFITRNFNEPFYIGDCEITLIPAGHILGSAQVLINDGNERWLYTGDFKLQPDSTCEAYQFTGAYILITETTFADPSVKHPDPVSEIEKINGFNDRNVIIAVYSIGKKDCYAKDSTGSRAGCHCWQDAGWLH